MSEGTTERRKHWVDKTTFELSPELKARLAGPIIEQVLGVARDWKLTYEETHELLDEAKNRIVKKG